MTTPPARPRTLTAQATQLAVSLMDSAGADGVLPASEVKVGTPLEEAGGHLYPFGTSGQDAGTTYLLVHVLPVTCGAARVPAGEPGAGAWRITLDQPVEAYVASGALREFTVTEG